MWQRLYRNTWQYARLILRRDRLRLPIWLVAITLLTLVVVPALSQLVSTEQERQAMAETMSNPAVTAMFGPGYGLDNYTIGAMMGHQMLLFTAIIVAIMSIMLVTRHTRGDEENGRLEVIRSFPVGRLSNLSATMLVLLGANVALSLMVGLGLYALGIESMDLKGSLLYGALLGATGMAFAAITGLFAQLSESSRGTMGYSFAFLIGGYLLRAVGDVGNETLSWFTPLGWIVRSQVYVNNYWWPVLLTAALGVATVGLALWLNSIRDLEAGFIPARPGSKTASAFLQTSLGLGFRLQRTAIIGWAVGMFVLGASYGSVMGDMETYLGALELMQEMLIPVEGLSLTEQFIPMLMAVISMVSAIPVLLMILKLRGEEKAHRTEHLLARAVSRQELMGSFLLISVILAFAMQLLAATGMWSAAAAVMDEPISFGLLFEAAMSYLPALWVMIGFAVLLIGQLPQGTGLIWLYLGYSFLVVYLGTLLQFPEWMASLSPFGHIPQIPVEDLDLAALLALTVLAVAISVAGLVGYRRRDMQI